MIKFINTIVAVNIYLLSVLLVAGAVVLSVALAMLINSLFYDGTNNLLIPAAIVIPIVDAPIMIFLLVLMIKELRASREQLDMRVRERTLELSSLKEFADKAVNAQIDTLFVFDPKTGKAVRWNNAFRKITGYTDDEIADLKAPDSYYSSEDLLKASAAPEVILKEGQRTLEMTLICKDGRRVPFEYIASAIMDDENNMKYIVAVGRDITERKKAQEELGKLASAIRFSSELVNMATMDGMMIFLNEAGCRILGVEPEEVSRTNIIQVIPEHLKALVEKELLPALMKGGTWEGDLQYLNLRTGRLTDVYASTYTIKDSESGRPLYLANVSRDITERKRSENALMESEGRLRSITENIADTIIMSDSTGRITYVNRLHPGLTREQVLSSTVFDFVPQEQISTVKRALADVFERGVVCSYESLGPGLQGEMNMYSVSVSPVFAGGKVISAVFLARDVTEKIRIENELLKIKKLESIGVLAGGIAHDFNNILSAILGNINLALFDKNLNDRTKSLLIEAEKASKRAAKLTQQLLTFAKGGEPVRELASLESVIRDSAGFVLHGDRVACQFSIPEDLWLVDVDKGQISQVIQNIVLNASQAMPEGGTITITCDNFSTSDSDLLPYAKEGKYVRVAIKDTGIGMPANVVDKIFDPYFTTKREGSGLGLAITQSIINRHNGYITVQSTPGRGTTFSIYLPASEETGVFQPAASEEAPAVSKATFLIMDDEEMVRNVLKSMLIKLGHEVLLTDDGNEAVKIYQNALRSDKPINMVIMDLTVPGGMGGQEAVKELLRIDPKAKVIVASGYSNDPVVANFQDYGFCGAITKPFRMQDLSRVIMKAL